MSEASLSLLLFSALVLFVGIYLREAIRLAHQQKIVAARVVAFYHLICSDIASFAHNADRLKKHEVIDESIETMLRDIYDNYIRYVTSRKELPELSKAINNELAKIVSCSDLKKHPLFEYAVQFNERYASMDEIEYERKIQTLKEIRNRYMDSQEMLFDKDGAVISTELAISISQIRSHYVTITQDAINVIGTAHHHGDNSDLHIHTVRELIKLLRKCAIIVQNTVTLMPEAEGILSKSTVRLAITKVFW